MSPGSVRREPGIQVKKKVGSGKQNGRRGERGVRFLSFSFAATFWKPKFREELAAKKGYHIIFARYHMPRWLPRPSTEGEKSTDAVGRASIKTKKQENGRKKLGKDCRGLGVSLVCFAP